MRDDGLTTGEGGERRCFWHGGHADYIRYHDDEWGRPVADDTRLFEKICLEGFQSGLSWLTILRKRDNFRAAFVGFDPQRVAELGPSDVERLLGDAGIVRHRGKIESTINNARRALDLQAEAGSLAAFVWAFEPGPDSMPAAFDRETLLARTTIPEAKALSQQLKRRGWSFVGPTTIFAFMQSVGMVNDHIEGCIVREACRAERAAFQRPGTRRSVAATPGPAGPKSQN